MAAQNNLEVWLRGPVSGIPPLLQPVAHALLQVREELNDLMQGFPDQFIWQKPAGMASVGFHLQHLTGVLDRLFTYARGLQLDASQLEHLATEGRPQAVATNSRQLVEKFNQQVYSAIQQLSVTDENSLTERRGVGRKNVPSTVLGLLFHAAEHSQRHYGQLLVTVAVVKQSNNEV